LQSNGPYLTYNIYYEDDSEEKGDGEKERIMIFVGIRVRGIELKRMVIMVFFF